MSLMTRLWFALVGVAIATIYQIALLAAAPTLGQHAAAANSSTTVTLNPTGLTNGSALIVAYSQSATGTRTYSVSDTNSNSYVEAVKKTTSAGSNNPHECGIHYAKNITTTGGATTITITQSGGGALTFHGQYVEVLGAHTTAPLDATSSASDSADTTSHNFATTMSTASDVFVYSNGAYNATAGTLTPTSSPAFTNLSADYPTSISLSQYYSGATALSSNNLAATSGTARTGAQCAASFIAPASSGGITGLLHLLGVGK